MRMVEAVRFARASSPDAASEVRLEVHPAPHLTFDALLRSRQQFAVEVAEWRIRMDTDGRDPVPPVDGGVLGVRLGAVDHLPQWNHALGGGAPDLQLVDLEIHPLMLGCSDQDRQQFVVLPVDSGLKTVVGRLDGLGDGGSVDAQAVGLGFRHERPNDLLLFPPLVPDALAALLAQNVLGLGRQSRATPPGLAR